MADPENRDSKNNSQPLVAVWMVTYNHGGYIEQAIKSVMMQQTSFDYKLYVGEDFSTDNTRQICKRLQQEYPEKIELFLHEKNIGAHPNGIIMYNVCFASGAKYTALLEGDDYWTDPLKLQKQVDFLEENADYSIGFHDVEILKNGRFAISNLSQNIPETTTILDLAKGNYIHTCSVVFRNHLFGALPEYLKTAPVGDYFVHMLNARHGNIKYFKEAMGVYRLHETSGWSSKKQHERELAWIDFLKKIQPNFSAEVNRELDKQISFYRSSHRTVFWYIKKIKNKIIHLTKFLNLDGK